jgi:hypothetical protein
VLGLSRWSAGIVLAQRWGVPQVAVVLAYLLCRRATSRAAPHQRGATRGDQRRTLDVTTGCAPLRRWVVARMPPTGPHRALAMAATTLGQRCTVRSIHGVIPGGAIPVAGHSVRATAKGAWQPQWNARLVHRDGAVPADGTVVVAADRGRYATWRCTTITALGWHPLLRINRQGTYRTVDHPTFRPLSMVVAKGGRSWQGTVTCFSTKERHLSCTLLARGRCACRSAPLGRPAGSFVRPCCIGSRVPDSWYVTNLRGAAPHTPRWESARFPRPLRR